VGVGELMTPHIIRILENHLREIAKVRRNPQQASVSVKAVLTARQEYPLPKDLSSKNNLVSRTGAIFEQGEPEIVSAVLERRIANQSAKLDVPAVTGERVAAPASPGLIRSVVRSPRFIANKWLLEKIVGTIF